MRGSELQSDGNPAQATLRYAQPPDLGSACRPVPRVDVLNTRDQRVGTFDGLLLSADSDTPRYIVLKPNDSARNRLLIPVGSAWFDQTTEAIRVDDEDVRSAPAFDATAFQRMSPAEVLEFERDVLASCCPEVLRGSGRPDYDTSSEFTCPDWLKAR